MSIQKCLLDNSSRMIKAMSTAKSNSNEVKTEVYQETSSRHESMDSDRSDVEQTVRIVPSKTKAVKVTKKFADESFMSITQENKEEDSKNYCEMYGSLLAQKLISLPEEDRLILMNQIDNLVFETMLQARKKKRGEFV